MYTATTHNVTVSVQPAFLDHESKPDSHVYLWSYTVRIENKSEQTLQLRTRYWEIIDGYGRKQEVHGAGVIGEQPLLKPGAYFEYTSGTPLPTSSGFMRGIYSMQTDHGEFIDITIPQFPLDIPGQKKPVH